MPIYEYRCHTCGEVTELLTGAGTANEPPRCRHCGSGDVYRIMSAPAAGSKGEGTSCCHGNRKDSCTPGECCGHPWPANDDYVKLP